jgi:hypothetical protein
MPVRFPAKVFQQLPKPALGPTQRPIQRATEIVFSQAWSGNVVKVPTHFHLAKKIKNAWSCNSTPSGCGENERTEKTLP